MIKDYRQGLLLPRVRHRRTRLVTKSHQKSLIFFFIRRLRIGLRKRIIESKRERERERERVQERESPTERER